VKLLIVCQSGLGIFEILFRDPGIFFSGVSFPLDQEEAVGQSYMVV